MRTKNQVYEALDEALAAQALVVYTIVNRELAQLVHDECDSLGLTSLDLLTPLLMRMSQHFGRSPGETPGLLHGVDEEYFRRVEAIEFTVKHDDGQEPRNLHKAEIVLVGVSRTSKTPLSIYLAHAAGRWPTCRWSRGLTRRRELFQVDSEPGGGTGHRSAPAGRIAGGASAQPRAGLARGLRRLRADRGRDRYAREIFRRHAWVVVDVTGKAVEETANEVLVKLALEITL